LFYWHEALPFTPPNVLVSMAVAALLLLWLQFYRGEYESARLSRTLAVAGLVLLGVKVIASVSLPDVQWIRQNLKSPAISLARAVYSLDYSLDNNIQAPLKGTPAATFNAFVRGQQPLPSKVVVMLVESWGERSDSLKQMGSSIQGERLRIVGSGFTTYHGSTLSGEFRELCSRYLSPSDELKNEAFRLDCAPTFLQRQGYRTSGLHGYQKEFYARGALWDRFGLSDRLFRGDLQDLERCPGPFEGICDTALIKRGIAVLDRDAGPSFVYMLTLSSHEPLSPSALM
jgi:hypothetical protein